MIGSTTHLCRTSNCFKIPSIQNQNKNEDTRVWSAWFNGYFVADMPHEDNKKKNGQSDEIYRHSEKIKCGRFLGDKMKMDGLKMAT